MSVKLKINFKRKHITIKSLILICFISLSVYNAYPLKDTITIYQHSEIHNNPVLEFIKDSTTHSYFIENGGQIRSSKILYYCYTNSIFLGLGCNTIFIGSIKSDKYLELEFVNSQTPIPIGLGPLKCRNNYFLGSRGDFLNQVCFTQILFQDIWSNIDITLRITTNGIKSDCIIHPGDDVSKVQVQVIEYQKMPLEGTQLKFGVNESQSISSTIIKFENKEELNEDFIKSLLEKYEAQEFEYNTTLRLTMDSLLFSTYLGGSEVDIGRDIAVDDEGNIFITGRTSSTSFPTLNAYDSTPNMEGSPNYYDCFISKFNTSGDLVYSTYIGGTFWEEGRSIVVDRAGNVFVAGSTRSVNFPTVNAYDSTYTGGGEDDTFLLKLNATGNGLIFSTYFGRGPSECRDLALDKNKDIYICGATRSDVFPIKNAYDESWNDGWDCFVSKMDSTCTSLIYSTYVGGTFSYTPPYDDRDDIAVAMAVDEFGNAYVTGYTNSMYFPTINAYDNTLGSWNTDDCFVFKLNATGNGLVYSSYIGGGGQDRATDISIDAAGCAYITGFTQSTDLPLVDAYDSVLNGTSDSFLVKLSPEGNQLLYSSFLGGNGTDSGQSLMCDAMDNIYLGGTTTSSDFPMVNGVTYNGNGSADCFVLRLNTTTDSLSYSTCVGGTMDDSVLSLTIDSYGTVYATGSTYSTDFPMVNPYDSTQNGASDVFLFLLPDFCDSDSDGIPDYNESLYGTDRFSADSDLDGLSDFQEIFTYLTNPLSNDTDSDMMTDRWELRHGLNPLDPTDANGDLDSDSLTNLQEYELGTDPGLSDSDLDGIPDGWEVSMGFNPLDSEIPLVEFLLFNINWVIIGSLIVIGVLAGVFYGVRPRLEKQRMIKKQEEEQEEIENVIKDLREDDTTYT